MPPKNLKTHYKNYLTHDSVFVVEVFASKNDTIIFIVFMGMFSPITTVFGMSLVRKSLISSRKGFLA